MSVYHHAVRRRGVVLRPSDPPVLPISLPQDNSAVRSHKSEEDKRAYIASQLVSEDCPVVKADDIAFNPSVFSASSTCLSTVPV